MLTKLTLGTAQFGLDYGINNCSGKPDIKESIEMLEYAYSNGIKSVDTAAAYGDSEIVIGKWIEDYPHEDLFITSKISSITDANISKNNIMGYLEEQICLSLEKLRIKKIDNILLHNFYDLINYGSILMDALIKLKDKGYVEIIGCSIYDLESIDTFSQYPFDSIQFPGSIFNQRILESDKLIKLKEKNVKIFVRSAFVQGLVFMNPVKLPKELAGIKKYLIQLKELSDDYNLSISEIAMGYLMNHDRVDSIVFGVDNINQLKEIIEIKNKNIINKEVIIDKFSTVPDKLVDPRNWRF